MNSKKALGALVVSGLLLAAGGGVARADVGQMIDIDIQGGYLQDGGPILNNGRDRYQSFADATGGTYYVTVRESKESHDAGNQDNGDAQFTYTTDAMTAISDESGKSSAMENTGAKKLFDGYMNADSARTLTLEGLDANKEYELVVYAQREVGQDTDLYINGSQVISNDSSLDSLTEATASNNYNGNYAYVDGLSTNDNGELSFTYQGQIDGFQVKEKPVPEPASVVLLGMGGALFSLYRSRKYRAIAV